MFCIFLFQTHTQKGFNKFADAEIGYPELQDGQLCLGTVILITPLFKSSPGVHTDTHTQTHRDLHEVLFIQRLVEDPVCNQRRLHPNVFSYLFLLCLIHGSMLKWRISLFIQLSIVELHYLLSMKSQLNNIINAKLSYSSLSESRLY